MRIFIVGYMGAGKSTVGKRLANKLEIPFIDLDDAFEERYRYSILRFFEYFGEDKFREFEQLLLHEIVKANSDVVISTGGGTAYHFDNMDYMNASGITVYLKLSPISISHRLKRARKQRPVIRNVPHKDMLGFISEQLSLREEFYNKAGIIVKGENIQLDDLLTQIRQDKT